MNDAHGKSGGRTHGGNHPRTESHLDVQRASEELKRFLEVFVRETGLALSYTVATQSGAAAKSPDGDDVLVSFSGPDESLLLERNGELLLALEHIAHRWLKLDPSLHDRVRLDSGDFRASRLEELKLSARVAAQRVRETGQEFRFNPMSSRERRIIHLELNGASDVRTASEGSGDHRQLVIYPASKRPGALHQRS